MEEKIFLVSKISVDRFRFIGFSRIKNKKYPQRRAFEYDSSCSVNRRILKLGRFKEMARGKLTNPPKDEEEDEWWLLAQHHGLVTPMLDWAYSAPVII